MGYNISRHSVIRNQPQLDELLEAKRDVLFPTSTPRNLAMKLWEALKSAEEFPEFQKYVKLKIMYEFRQVEDGVLCKYLIDDTMPAEKVKEIEEKPKAKASTRKPSSRLECPDAMNIYEVMGFALEHDNVEEIHFPDAILPPKSSQLLWEWTQKDDVEWQFISHDTAGVTLTKKAVPHEILWEPSSQGEVDGKQ